LEKDIKMSEFCNFKINYANIKSIDTADGEGVRVALYVSGCSFKCEGCHNKEAWDYNYGDPFTEETLISIIHDLNKKFIAGFSILGGEPLDEKNRDDVFKIISIIKEKFPNKTIWLWTGNTWENIIKNDIIPKDILGKIDIIVDGPFILKERNLSLKFRGSNNQRVIDVKESLKHNSVICYLN
jgi:anaerobic ribonucleoside-triphosphate reductase activating protein